MWLDFIQGKGRKEGYKSSRFEDTYELRGDEEGGWAAFRKGTEHQVSDMWMDKEYLKDLVMRSEEATVPNFPFSKNWMEVRCMNHQPGKSSPAVSVPLSS